MHPKALFFCMLLISLTLLGGCAGESGIPYVWIDVPLMDSHIPGGQSVSIAGHAAGASGIAWVEILVDGESLAKVEDLTMQKDLAGFEFEWLPPSDGTYLIQVFSVDASGAISDVDQARVIVGGVTEEDPVAVATTETPTPTPTETNTPTETPLASAVQFWADPAQIQAGACTTLRWSAENVAGIVFGGLERPLEGSFEDCLCKDELYTLTVLHLDGSEERLQVSISVLGSCETPTPTEVQADDSQSDDAQSNGGGSDTEAPAVPVQVVPDNGLTLSCRASQNMVWQPVSDASGIDYYQVEVERHPGDDNWQAVSGSIFSPSDKEQSVAVECGWYYRWRVRAVDGAGNVGAWSGWWTYIITLT